jgi:hypothetical protein
MQTNLKDVLKNADGKKSPFGDISLLFNEFCGISRRS